MKYLLEIYFSSHAHPRNLNLSLKRFSGPKSSILAEFISLVHIVVRKYGLFVHSLDWLIIENCTTVLAMENHAISYLHIALVADL